MVINMNYYDRLYGKINLDPILEEMVLLCPEIKRLRYVGMMNYRSLGMLGLTSISRLEHVIGTAYLSQVFAYESNISSKNDLLVAALYHDVNCAPFGHAIEWAIDRYTDYKHEYNVNWIVDKNDKININMPKFYDENGLHRYHFDDKYKLNLNNVVSYIQGKNSFVINSDGIDLDNIDNVYRMAASLGLLKEESSYPLLLSKNLKVVTGYDNFVLKDKYQHLIEHWYLMRSTVYRKFIYSREYFAYEALLFKLIAEYVKTCETADIANIWTQTDDLLLSMMMTTKRQELQKVNEFAKKLILFDYDYVHFLIKTRDFSKKNETVSNEFQTDLVRTCINRYNTMEGIPSRLDPDSMYLHITTDNKKTGRKIPYYLEDIHGNITPTFLGCNEQSLVFGLLGKVQIPEKWVQKLAAIFIEELEIRHVSECILAPFVDEEPESYEQLGLF